MDDLFLLIPVEIWWEISQQLILDELVQLHRVNRRCRAIFTELICRRTKDLPWSIVLDFSRTKNHRLQLHHAWLKIGWFSFRNLNMKTIPIFFEICCQHALSDSPHYRLVRSGQGGPHLFRLLACRRKGYLAVSRGYRPSFQLCQRAEEIMDENDLIISTACAMGEDRFDPDVLIFSDEGRHIQTYDDYDLSFKNHRTWSQITEYITSMNYT